MKKGLWRSLERLSTQAALLLEWERELGEQFAMAQPFLCPSSEHVDSYPCTQEFPCGCRHRMVCTSEEEMFAYCDCEDGGCDPIRLRPIDLVVYKLAGPTLGEAIRRALGLEPYEGQACEGLKARQIGIWGARRSPVFFYVPISPGGTLKELERLSALVKRPFIFLTPTDLFTRLEMLRRNGCVQVELAGVLELGGDRELSFTASGKGIWEAALDQFQKGFLAVSDTEELLRGIHREIATVRTEFQELRKAKARLEQMQAEGLFKFTQKVDAKSFKVLCAILAEGDVAKACRALEMRSSTMWDLVRGWPKRGQAYAVMADLVRWRKAVGRTEVVPLNDAILTERASQVDYPALIADVLDGILEMTEGNWEDKAEELAECLRTATMGE